MVQVRPSRPFISAKVRSGSFATNSFSSWPLSGNSFAFLPENRCLASIRPVRRLCNTSFLTIPKDTRKRFATSSCVHLPSS